MNLRKIEKFKPITSTAEIFDAVLEVISVREKVAESHKAKERIRSLEKHLIEVNEKLKSEQNEFETQRALVLSNVSTYTHTATSE